MYKTIAKLIYTSVIITLISCSTAKIERTTITNYLPNPILDSIPISNKSKEFKLFRIRNRQSQYLISAIPKGKNKNSKLITYGLDEVVDNNNEIISRHYPSNEFAHDIYSGYILKVCYSM